MTPHRTRRLLLIPLSLAVLAWAGAATPQDGKFPPIVNTQNPKDVPPTPHSRHDFVADPVTRGSCGKAASRQTQIIVRSGTIRV